MRGEPQNFLKTALVTETDDCILWPFAASPAGYGRVWWEDRVHVTSRLVCMLVHGQPPTPKHEAAHLCQRGNLGCINHRHLEWQTKRQNNAVKRRLTEDEVAQIIAMDGTVSRREIAERFGLSAHATVNKIIHGRIYK